MRPDRTDWFYASGYDGQRILCIPEKDAVIVRLGRTPVDEVSYVWERVNAIGEAL
jgi:CubicO group peptidase (beta-lactamase class C family)